jgi:uncharacterized protein
LALVFWDTNLFVYLLEENPKFGESIRKLGRRMEARGDRLVTSALTIGEILVRPIRENDADSEKRYRALFSGPEVQIAAFDANAAYVYGRVRQDAAIRTADAIQLACAASAKVDLFITNDERLSRKNVAGIHFVTSLDRAPI